METKTILVGAVALAAILVAAFILPSPAPAVPPAESGDYPNPLGGQNATMEEFANHLMNSQTIYLVEDIRGLEKYPLSRNNIMQCGVDFAGSQGLVDKEVNIYVLEEEKCSASESGGNLTIKTLSECHAAASSAFGRPGNAVIWIEKGYSPSVYRGGLVVRINETYTQGMCNIRFVIPVEEASGSLPANETPMEGEAPESVTWESPIEAPENGSSGVETTSEEAAPEETASAEPVEPAPVPPYAD